MKKAADSRRHTGDRGGGMKKAVDSRQHTVDRGGGMMARARRQNPPAVIPIVTQNSELRTLNSSGEAVCIGCGCSDSHACVTVLGPCWWIKADYGLGIGVCSECDHKVEEYEDRVLVSRKGAKGVPDDTRTA
jgi:hypothetical protein